VATISEKDSKPNNLNSAASQTPPEIVDVDIRSDIQFRYAKTVVKTYIKNPSISTSQEVEFNMVLPESAFISNFTIQIIGEDQVYVSQVAKKEEAKQKYEEAVGRGQSAGIVDADTRDANKITIKSNLEATSKMVFTLTYEQLLERRFSKYGHIIHVNPGQIVKNFNVNVHINESLPITEINVPELKVHANEVTSQLKPNKFATITRNVDGQPNRAHIQFHPTPEDQKQMTKISKRTEQGMVGQFIVQYDVDRQNQGNEVQVLDGYFVHFFAPDQLEVMQKHVVFVLDVSGSMGGTKLAQTKAAMAAIINDLSDRDYFNILAFSDDVYHWDRNRPKDLNIISDDPGTTISAYPGTSSIRKEALQYVQALQTVGGTNINDGLNEALNVAEKIRKSESIPGNVKPIIIFLTDGQATEGITDDKIIRKNVRNRNSQLHVPVYGLAFGNGADFNLLKAISTENDAFARKIYEASDAAIQLEDFYHEVASPVLTDVKFDYVGESFQNKTMKKFNTFFKGGEFIIAGKLNNDVKDDNLEIVVSGGGKTSSYKKVISPCHLKPYNEFKGHEPCIHVPPIPQQPKSEAENFIERLWAFLTIENLLNEKETTTTGNTDIDKVESSDKSANEEKALQLALKYNFVTKLTSLFVIKPDDEKPKDGETESAPTAVNLEPISSSNMGRSSGGRGHRRYNSPTMKGGGRRTLMKGGSAPTYNDLATNKVAYESANYDYGSNYPDVGIKDKSGYSLASSFHSLPNNFLPTLVVLLTASLYLA
jgi:uncharacterized protein YegL